ncbi:MAG: GIY-YIG nuclease family protein [Patescibacteria group bacterium]
MSFYFYLARCSDESLYAGFCVNLKNRERAHNEGKGAKYTRARRPVKIVYSEEFSSRTEAMRREAQIKNWSRIKKENLILFSAKN